MHRTDRKPECARSRTLVRTAAPAAWVAAIALYLACSPGGDGVSGSVIDRGDGEEERAAASVEPRLGDAIVQFEVKARLLDALHWDAIGIEVDALDGRVLLTGQVPDHATREMAEEIAGSVEGVEGTESRLVLADDGEAQSRRGAMRQGISSAGRAVRDALLVARLKVRLLQQIGRHGLDLDVQATDGVVTLRGRCPNEVHERVTLEAASTTPGVQRILNRIETGGAETTDA